MWLGKDFTFTITEVEIGIFKDNLLIFYIGIPKMVHRSKNVNL